MRDDRGLAGNWLDHAKISVTGVATSAIAVSGLVFELDDGAEGRLVL